MFRKLLGTLDYESGEIFVIESDRYDVEVFLSFLQQVLARYPGEKIVMVLDNARIHHANLLQPFLESNKDRLDMVFLPPYSPNLNLIEEFWGWLKHSCIYKFFIAQWMKFARGFKGLLHKSSKCPKWLLTDYVALCKSLMDSI